MSQCLDSDFDLIVIGAGINGAGIARDATMRGLKVLLVDKGDIGGGTSSWSTRLIHGGLRYLEHGEFGLVRESLRERETLMRIAPHLVRPLPILLPIYKNARRGAWTIRMGMWAYDLLSFDKTLPRHRFLTRQQALQEVPSLESHGLEGAAVYYDAQVEFAERLVVENALSAVAHGATVQTYTRVQDFILKDQTITGVRLANEKRCETLIATPRIVINAAGPWVDDVLNKGAASKRLIGGTKGSHIIVAPFPGAPETAICVEAESDGRLFFIIPWNRNYLIGTTDIRFEGNVDNVRIDGAEVDYLLRETNRVLPQAQLGREQILYSYSGIRPLPFTDECAEESITRRHFIHQHPAVDNLVSIVGGKLTTYRSLSEEVVDLIFDKLGRRPPKSQTAIMPLPGHPTNSLSVAPPRSLSEKHLTRLTGIYGSRTRMLFELIEEQPSLAEVFDEETNALAAEVVFAYRSELAQTLADCLLRRNMVGLNSTCGMPAVERAAQIYVRYLGGSRTRANQEVVDYEKAIARLRLP